VQCRRVFTSRSGSTSLEDMDGEIRVLDLRIRNENCGSIVDVWVSWRAYWISLIKVCEQHLLTSFDLNSSGELIPFIGYSSTSVESFHLALNLI